MSKNNVETVVITRNRRGTRIGFIRSGNGHERTDKTYRLRSHMKANTIKTVLERDWKATRIVTTPQGFSVWFNRKEV